MIDEPVRLYDNNTHMPIKPSSSEGATRAISLPPRRGDRVHVRLHRRQLSRLSLLDGAPRQTGMMRRRARALALFFLRFATTTLAAATSGARTRPPRWHPSPPGASRGLRSSRRRATSHRQSVAPETPRRAQTSSHHIGRRLRSIGRPAHDPRRRRRRGDRDGRGDARRQRRLHRRLRRRLDRLHRRSWYTRRRGDVQEPAPRPCHGRGPPKSSARARSGASPPSPPPRPPPPPPPRASPCRWTGGERAAGPCARASGLPPGRRRGSIGSPSSVSARRLRGRVVALTLGPFLLLRRRDGLGGFLPPKPHHGHVPWRPPLWRLAASSSALASSSAFLTFFTATPVCLELLQTFLRNCAISSFWSCTVVAMLPAPSPSGR